MNHDMKRKGGRKNKSGKKKREFKSTTESCQNFFLFSPPCAFLFHFLYFLFFSSFQKHKECWKSSLPTFCSFCCVSRMEKSKTSAWAAAVPILSARFSILISHASISCRFDSYLCCFFLFFREKREKIYASITIQC